MSDEGEVRFERRDRTVFLTFARAHARNAMTWKMYDELFAHCEALHADDGTRVVVLRGEGEKAFVAGTDIGQFAEFSSGEDGLRYEERIEEILDSLERLPQTTVAAVDGYAVGGGLTIAAVCDLRLCTPEAKFGLPIARTLGNCISMRNTARLVALLGPAHAKALIMQSRFVPAEEALGSGLATEVVERERMDERLGELTAALETYAPLTMWATKEAIRRLTVAELPDDTDIVRTVYGSRDFKEGVAAFTEKRQAEWQNR